MTLSTVPVGNYFLHEGKVHYKGRTGVMGCQVGAGYKIFSNYKNSNITCDPEVEILSGEQAYKELKKVELSL